jgi:hypothetical protein
MIAVLLVCAFGTDVDVTVGEFMTKKHRLEKGQTISFLFPSKSGFLYIGQPSAYSVSIGAGCNTLDMDENEGCTWYHDA